MKKKKTELDLTSSLENLLYGQLSHICGCSRNKINDTTLDRFLGEV